MKDQNSKLNLCLLWPKWEKCPKMSLLAHLKILSLCISEYVPLCASYSYTHLSLGNSNRDIIATVIVFHIICVAS